jgi:hypothetical protein
MSDTKAPEAASTAVVPPAPDDWDDEDPWNKPAATCEHCHGTGGDPWNDGITPCEHCDGEGYEWWN